MSGTAVVERGGPSWWHLAMLLMFMCPGAFLVLMVAAQLLMPLVFLVLAYGFFFGWNWPQLFPRRKPPVAPIDQLRKDRERFLAQREKGLQPSKPSTTTKLSASNTRRPRTSKDHDAKLKEALAPTVVSSGSSIKLSLPVGKYCQPVDTARVDPGSSNSKQKCLHQQGKKKQAASNNKKAATTSRYQAIVQEAMSYRAPRTATSSTPPAPTATNNRNEEETETTFGMVQAGYIPASSDAVVYTDELSSTRFLHVPTLAGSDHAAFLLRKMAREFMPIIHRRGYNVYTVSEMCCCTDGARAARGEVALTQKMRASTGNCLGYNFTRPSQVGQPKFHDIFVRLRKDPNHYDFENFHEIINTMAHELAHCVYKEHSPAFWKLVRDIEAEHRMVCAVGEVNEGLSVEEQYGFNIYGSSTSKKTE